MPLLSVNIDHAATLRQARYRGELQHNADAGEPDPVRVAHEAELGGADGITIHLREDRRHVQDRDVELLRRLVRVRFNLEMAATDEMVAISRSIEPHTAMLVPEGRQEVTTEGGLDVAGQTDRVKAVVEALHDAGVMVSIFIDADARQIEAARAAGADICEIHTGPYAHAFRDFGGDFRRRELLQELRRVRDAAAYIADAGMRVNAGHALNYANVVPVAQIVNAANMPTGPAVTPTAAAAAASERGELHIGHAIISRAIFTGIRVATAEMKRCIAAAVARPLGAIESLDMSNELNIRPDPTPDLPRGTRLA